MNPFAAHDSLPSLDTPEFERCSIAEIASALKLSPEQVSARSYQMKLLCVRLFRSHRETFFEE